MRALCLIICFPDKPFFYRQHDIFISAERDCFLQRNHFFIGDNDSTIRVSNRFTHNESSSTPNRNKVAYFANFSASVRVAEIVGVESFGNRASVYKCFCQNSGLSDYFIQPIFSRESVNRSQTNHLQYYISISSLSPSSSSLSSTIWSLLSLPNSSWALRYACFSISSFSSAAYSNGRS